MKLIKVEKGWVRGKVIVERRIIGEDGKERIIRRESDFFFEAKDSGTLILGDVTDVKITSYEGKYSIEEA